MKIEYPTQTTYFICKNSKGEVRGYGRVEPEQVMETRYEVESFLSEEEWKLELIRNNIKTEENETETE